MTKTTLRKVNFFGRMCL